MTLLGLLLSPPPQQRKLLKNPQLTPPTAHLPNLNHHTTRLPAQPPSNVATAPDPAASVSRPNNHNGLMAAPRSVSRTPLPVPSTNPMIRNSDACFPHASAEARRSMSTKDALMRGGWPIQMLPETTGNVLLANLPIRCRGCTGLP